MAAANPPAMGTTSKGLIIHRLLQSGLGLRMEGIIKTVMSNNAMLAPVIIRFCKMEVVGGGVGTLGFMRQRKKCC